ncbi:MAG: sodium:solute symporter family protein [bacterium]|nr:sodium:solute symporter family protein [bacterium]
MIPAVLITYLAVVLTVGVLGHRLFRATGEDFFLASRTIGPFVLLMTLAGTHMTAFSLLGASDEAYRAGVGVFALMGSSTAIEVPFLFLFIGTRMWAIGKRHGYLTQVQFIRERYDCGWLGLLLFVVLVLLLIPYVLIGVMGAGDALYIITGGSDGGVPTWVGSILICAVIFTYVAYGGMRSTAWVNAFQTSVFMAVGAVAFFFITSQYGGVGEAMARVQAEQPELLSFGSGRPAVLRMISFVLLPCSAGMFPHLFSHWLSARSASTFKSTVVLYPLCIAVVWLPSVVLGVTGRLTFPEPPGGPVLPALIFHHSGGILAGLLGAGVFAAIMSSLDSQTLAAGTMFTTDIVRYYGFHNHISERQQVVFGRLFVLVLLALAFIASQFTTKSIFSMGVWSLTGFTGLLPVIFAALYWRRSTCLGVAASILTTAGLWIYFYIDSLGIQGLYTIAGSGLMPVAVILPASALALVFISLVTRPPKTL